MDEKTENKSKENKEKKEEQNNYKKYDSKELLTLINTLKDFETDLKSLKSINSILTKDNLLFFKKLFLKENILINLSLIRIYMGIINNKLLYNEYFLLSISTINIQSLIQKSFSSKNVSS